jgi:tetratricopeptide (TPR) repeat protein
MIRHPLFQSVAFVFAAFAFATALVPDVVTGSGTRARDGNVFALALGEGRKLLAYEFFVKADAYFHSGYYPSVFDRSDAFKSPHMAADAGAIADENNELGEEFEGGARDIIERIGRHFRPAAHTHLDEGGAHGHEHEHEHEHSGELGDSGEVREILPWLRLSASLDPSREETYTTTAYWLRRRMNRVDEAERFLREGLRHNPRSYSILFELGRIEEENRRNADKARRLWELAFQRWQEVAAGEKEPDLFGLSQIVSRLGALAEREGNRDEAVRHFTILRRISPNPEAVQKRIDELKAEAGAGVTSPNREDPDRVRTPR